MKNKLPLIIILAIGIFTPVFSTLLFFFWSPDKYNNIGTVLEPVSLQTTWQQVDGKRFDLSQWQGQWVILFSGNGACDEACQKYLCKTRQLRRMMHGNYLRIKRAWLINDQTVPPTSLLQTTDCGEVNSDDLHEHIQTVDTLEGIDIFYGSDEILPINDGTVATDFLYIIDPQGLLAMRFSADKNLYQIKKDFSRLLKLSKGHKKFSNTAEPTNFN